MFQSIIMQYQLFDFCTQIKSFNYPPLILLFAHRLMVINFLHLIIGFKYNYSTVIIQFNIIHSFGHTKMGPSFAM